MRPSESAAVARPKRFWLRRSCAFRRPQPRPRRKCSIIPRFYAACTFQTASFLHPPPL
ncbi:hypothetical protein HMPREF9120_02449 [Neisseria sp. oral taxon 020 str. F0370]|nr:hypothetical protein HMPREF9120_02449 [Neisseria sp. oral taxon 020 str. F0370]